MFLLLFPKPRRNSAMKDNQKLKATRQAAHLSSGVMLRKALLIMQRRHAERVVSTDKSDPTMGVASGVFYPEQPNTKVWE